MLLGKITHSIGPIKGRETNEASYELYYKTLYAECEKYGNHLICIFLICINMIKLG